MHLLDRPQALQLLFAEEAGDWYASSASPALHDAAAAAHTALLSARSVPQIPECIVVCSVKLCPRRSHCGIRTRSYDRKDCAHQLQISRY
jgi:hypothetical protein